LGHGIAAFLPTRCSPRCARILISRSIIFLRNLQDLQTSTCALGLSGLASGVRAPPVPPSETLVVGAETASLGRDACRASPSRPTAWRRLRRAHGASAWRGGRAAGRCAGTSGLFLSLALTPLHPFGVPGGGQSDPQRLEYGTQRPDHVVGQGRQAGLFRNRGSGESSRAIRNPSGSSSITASRKYAISSFVLRCSAASFGHVSTQLLQPILGLYQRRLHMEQQVGSKDERSAGTFLAGR
jgi:hypothetical protein